MSISPPSWLPETAGQEADFLFFWGHQPRPDGTTGPGCLSQWWPAPFSIDDITYPTAEHWMMAAKARLFRDDQALAAVLAANSPTDAKAVGRAVRGYREQDWAAARFDLVVGGSVAKFRQNPDLADFLRGTGRRFSWRPALGTASGASAWARATRTSNGLRGGAGPTCSGLP